MSNSNVMTILIQDREKGNLFSPSKSIKVIDPSNIKSAETATNLFVLASVTGLSEISDVLKSANQKHHLRALFIREDIEAKWLPQMFDRANLRSMRNTFVYQNSDLPQRVINAWSMEAQDQLIAEAIAIDDYLLVFSCAMEKLEIPFDSMNALKRIPIEDRGNFEIDVDGSYLYWEKADIHLDLDAFRGAIDPVWKQKTEALKLSHDQAFGQAIATLRKQYKLRQSDIKGVSSRQVSRIENGEATKLETLELFAKAHNLEINDYLNRVADLIHYPDNHDSMVTDKLDIETFSKDDLWKLAGSNEMVEISKVNHDSIY